MLSSVDKKYTTSTLEQQTHLRMKSIFLAEKRKPSKPKEDSKKGSEFFSYIKNSTFEDALIQNMKNLETEQQSQSHDILKKIIDPTININAAAAAAGSNGNQEDESKNLREQESATGSTISAKHESHLTPSPRESPTL